MLGQLGIPAFLRLCRGGLKNSRPISTISAVGLRAPPRERFFPLASAGHPASDDRCTYSLFGGRQLPGGIQGMPVHVQPCSAASAQVGSRQRVGRPEGHRSAELPPRARRFKGERDLSVDQRRSYHPNTSGLENNPMEHQLLRSRAGHNSAGLAIALHWKILNFGRYLAPRLTGILFEVERTENVRDAARRYLNEFKRLLERLPNSQSIRGGLLLSRPVGELNALPSELRAVAVAPSDVAEAMRQAFVN
jgi:hypothetical protein